ncbi:non-hydrolyzing UDP-N-acetylglucosamine 2-epimerase [Metaclostridioides mangenotii]|uniref:non-hydrolyzing UDP-N-acetylglucosamine 2-epimerase n=1 Tax=Metaclostridioides mangenotii TaxID=1540 RepID=UPI00068B6BB7|nr:UDP-N-acetylglucosamine 2-epimerase (non-hydrolyzing) [Clostridioides mangenotii]
MSDLKKVLIGSPIHQTLDILKEFLISLKELDKSNFDISYYFIDDNIEEISSDYLKYFKESEKNYDLNIMKVGQTLTDITSKALSSLDRVMKEVNPDLVLVHEDTTTTFVGGLSAFYNKAMIGHVEAGLRTYDKYSPFPEEVNRQLTGILADIHFAPTEHAKENLLKEGKDINKIFVTGNTAIDALNTTVSDDYYHEVLDKLKDDRMILLTAHRRENLGENMYSMFRAIKRIVMNSKMFK